MLSTSHIAAAAFKALFGLIGFLTFAEFTQKEISNSLPNQYFKILINLVLVVKALLSYPLPFFAIVQLLTDNFFRGVKYTPFQRYLFLCKSVLNNLYLFVVVMELIKASVNGLPP